MDRKAISRLMGRWAGWRSGAALGSGTVDSLLSTDRAKSPGSVSPSVLCLHFGQGRAGVRTPRPTSTGAWGKRSFLKRRRGDYSGIWGHWPQYSHLVGGEQALNCTVLGKHRNADNNGLQILRFYDCI